MYSIASFPVMLLSLGKIQGMTEGHGLVYSHISAFGFSPFPYQRHGFIFTCRGWGAQTPEVDFPSIEFTSIENSIKILEHVWFPPLEEPVIDNPVLIPERKFHIEGLLSQHALYMLGENTADQAQSSLLLH